MARRIRKHLDNLRMERENLVTWDYLHGIVFNTRWHQVNITPARISPIRYARRSGGTAPLVRVSIRNEPTLKEQTHSASAHLSTHRTASRRILPSNDSDTRLLSTVGTMRCQLCRHRHNPPRPACPPRGRSVG